MNFLKKPYPFNDDLKRNAKLIFVITVSIFVFLYLFQPLDISSLENRDKLYLIIGLAIITFLGLSGHLLVMPSMFPKIFLRREWKIWKEIVWNSWMLFTISFGYFLSYRLLGILEVDFYMIIKLILIAVFPLTLLIVFNQHRLLKIHLKNANELNAKLKESKNDTDRLVHFDSEYQKDKLSMKARLLLLIRSADNYIEIFWKDGDTINSRMVRSTLTKAQDLLSEYNYVFKCHRSYIVNIKFIDRVEGNSQGYRLFIENIDFEIPVSKMAVDQLKEKVKLF